MRGASFNLRHLRGFCVVARAGSFARATEDVGLSQPALSLAMASLERASGVRLLDRAWSGSAVTAEGAHLADRLETALCAFDEAVAAVLPTMQLRMTRLATMRQLSALAAVDLAGSFAFASRALGRSQSTLHRAVRSLEARLGVELVAPRGRGVASTAEGAALAKAARLLVTGIEHAFDDLEVAGPIRGQIRVGAMPLARGGILPAALNDLCRAHPYIACHVAEGAYPELLRLLLRGDIDVVVGALRGADATQVVETHLYDDLLVVVGRAGHPLLSARAPADALAANYPWVTSPKGTPRRALWDAMFQARGLAPPIPRVECSSASVVRSLLLRGDWLAILSPDQFLGERQLGLLEVIDDRLPLATRAIGLSVREGWTPGRAHEAFLAAMRAAVAAEGFGSERACTGAPRR